MVGKSPHWHAQALLIVSVAWRRASLALQRLLIRRELRHTAFDPSRNWQVGDDSIPPSVRTRDVDPTIPGVNVIGFFRRQFGLGEAARAYAGALWGTGAPIALRDVDLRLPHEGRERAFDGLLGLQVPHSISMICVNPDYMRSALRRIRADHPHYRVACWFWELESLPKSWRPMLTDVDEFIAPSSFVRDALRKETSKPVTVIPVPLIQSTDSGLTREHFGLPEHAFIFLCSFDFNSWIARKNPFAAIAAFRKAFPSAQSEVRLLVKTANAAQHPAEARKLLRLASLDARIIVRDGVLNRAHVCALQRCCDAFVSLHRAEGFGLGLAECMSLGKPVVATGWSGNVDFMSEQNSFLVDYKLVHVASGDYPEADGARWAEPDVEHAARIMARLAASPELANTTGLRGRHDIQEFLSPARTGRALVDLLQSIHQRRAISASRRNDT